MSTITVPVDVSAPEAEGARLPLLIRDLTVAYQRKPVLCDIDLAIPPGRLVAIVGPNGAGKSTLIRAVMDLAPRVRGEIQVYGRSYARNRQLVGYVPQRESVDWDFPVSALDVVTMGRYGRIGLLRPVRRHDKQAAMEALEQVGMADLAHRQISQLSGGQQQRVFLARALAQDAQLYLMDEPFSAVDAATEQAIVEVLRQMQRAGKTVLVVHHDLQTVQDYFDHTVLLNVKVVAQGPTREVFTPRNLQETYSGRLVISGDEPARRP